MKKGIKGIKHYFLSLNMSTKMSLIFALIVFITINSIYSLYADIYEEDMTQDAITVFEQTAYLYEEKIGNLLESTGAITKAPFYFGGLQEELLAGEVLSTESLRNLYYSVVASNISNANKYVIMMYDSEGKLVFANVSLENSYITEMDPNIWMKRVGESNGMTFLLPIRDSKDKFCFLIAENIISIESFTKIGFIAVAIPGEELQQIYDSVAEKSGGRVLIYNGSDELLFSSEEEAYLPAEISRAVELSSENKIQIDTEEYLGYCSVQSGNKYKILIYEEKDVLFSDMRHTQKFMRMMEIVAIFVTICLTILMANFVTKPLRKITALMHKVEDGNLEVRFHPLYDDEIGIMSNTFDLMLDKIADMQKHIVEVNNAKKQAEIDALKGQINPHFMYNTIETFRMIAIEKDDEELADLLWRFGKMMRYNITTMNELATIRSELEYMQYYIDIQNCRYNGQIQLICEVSEELKEYSLIKLLIQPIVENAVFHGLKKNIKSIGFVKIHIYHTSDKCVIEISDNGVGISEETLGEIRELLNLRYEEIQTSKFIGLRNVNERIKLFYGNSYGVRINNRVQGGVLVTIFLPYHEDAEGEMIERQC